jgi:hypothetical protein
MTSVHNTIEMKKLYGLPTFWQAVEFSRKTGVSGMKMNQQKILISNDNAMRRYRKAILSGSAVPV